MFEYDNTNRLVQRERERIKDIYRTIRLIGIAREEFDQLDYTTYATLEEDKPEHQHVVEQAATLREKARQKLADVSLNPNAYIAETIVEPEAVADMPLLEGELGKVALLGMTERSLADLEFDAPLALHTQEKLISHRAS